MTRALRVLQIGAADEGGGAAAIARGLMRAYRARGCRVWHAVGRTRSRDFGVILLPDDRRAVYRRSGYAALQATLRRLAARHPNRGWGLASRSLRSLTHVRAMTRRVRGLEDFEFPGTYDVLDLLDAPPDVAHCHNLHGGYFDLRALAWLSHRVPTVLTLHDMWLLTGHCAYSLDCDRWKIGCGQCPDLNLYPSIRRDATAPNWRRKQTIYAQSQLHIATPSQWLLDQVGQSMLAPSLRDARVIPNGVDLSVFRPADKQAVRAALGIPATASVVLLTTGSRGSMWKDDHTLQSAMERIAERPAAEPTLFVALGRESALPRNGQAHSRSVPYQTDPRAIAKYYQAADLYMHAARADTFPTAILEALACGTPVVATRIGGIPEQIRSADVGALSFGSSESFRDATGVLVPPGDARRMADAVVALLANDASRRRLGDNAAQDARARFDFERQVETYLAWYGAVIEEWKAAQSTASSRPA